MKCLSLSIVGFFALAATGFSQEAAAAPSPKQVDFLEVLSKGGPMMIVLGLLSILTVLLVLVFLMTIRRNTIVSDRFMNQAEQMIRTRDFHGLMAFCDRTNQCIARIAQKALDFLSNNPGLPFDSVQDVAQTEGSRQSGLLTSRITYLSEIGAIAPMIGLLGTVIGMIKAFIEISSGGKQGVRQMELAEGVSEALIATACGLAISIVAFVFYSFFRSRVQRYVAELEAAATHLISLLRGQLERPHQQPSAPSQPQPQQQHHHAHQQVPYASPPALPIQQKAREDYAMPVNSPLAGDRPDLHGI